MDPYAYVEDNPETRTDPSGQCDVWCWLANIVGIGGVVLVAIGLLPLTTGIASAALIGAGLALFTTWLTSTLSDGLDMNGAEGQGVLLGEVISAAFGAFGGFLGAPGVVTMGAKGVTFFSGFWSIIAGILGAGIGKGYSSAQRSSSTPVAVAAPTPTPNLDPDKLYTNPDAIELLQDSVSIDEETGSQSVYNSDITPQLDYKDTHFAAKMAQSNTLTKQLGWSWQNWEYNLWVRWAFSTNNISSDSWALYQGQAVSDLADQVRLGKRLGLT